MCAGQGHLPGPKGVAVAGEAGEVRAGRAIVAIPPTLAGRLVYNPPLPGPSGLVPNAQQKWRAIVLERGESP